MAEDRAGRTEELDPDTLTVNSGADMGAALWYDAGGVQRMSVVDATYDGVLSEMVERLVRGPGPTRIYLFGSRARGDDDPDSDYDLLVVVRESAMPGYRQAQEAFRLLYGVGVAKDVVVLTEDEFDRKRNVPGAMPETVVREGVLLYAA